MCIRDRTVPAAPLSAVWGVFQFLGRGAAYLTSLFGQEGIEDGPWSKAVEAWCSIVGGQLSREVELRILNRSSTWNIGTKDNFEHFWKVRASWRFRGAPLSGWQSAWSSDSIGRNLPVSRGVPIWNGSSSGSNWWSRTTSWPSFRSLASWPFWRGLHCCLGISEIYKRDNHGFLVVWANLSSSHF